MMHYKGYTGKVEFDPDAKILFGRVIDPKDIITFEGMTVDEIQQAFKDSVDDYLEFCQELGKEPDKPFSGKLVLRTSPRLHKTIYLAAIESNKSINAWMDEALEREAEQVLSGAKNL